MRVMPHRLLFLLSTAMILLFIVLSAAKTLALQSQSSTSSPWAPAAWTLALDFGRRQNDKPFYGNNKYDSLPSDDDKNRFCYGASGSRLVTFLDVQIESTSVTPNSPLDDFVGPGASRIIPLSTGTYINLKGQQSVYLSAGGWTLEFPPGGKKGLASTLRFWMDILDQDLERNDVKLVVGERLYFVCKAWREDEYEVGLNRMRPIQEAARQAQKLLDQTLSHSDGDRRLDGTDALKTLQAYKDMAELVLNRDVKRQEWIQALEKYPPILDGSDQGDSLYTSPDLPEGPWPGTEQWLTLSNQNPILVARRRLLRLEYHVVGQWTATPILSEEDYEPDDTTASTSGNCGIATNNNDVN